MPDLARARPPLVVVALGDPSSGDQGLPARAMGRVRTIIGEIGRLRAAPAAEDRPQETGSQTTKLALARPLTAGALIEWVEGAGDPRRLIAVLKARRRVVLMDVVRLGSAPGTVYHWHLRPHQSSDLTLLTHYGNQWPLGLDHLAFWLEDDLPSRGMDLIGVEPADLTPGRGLSRPIRRRLPAICSQMAAILLRVFTEEGW